MNEQRIVQWWAQKPGVAPDWQPMRDWLSQQPADAVSCCYAMTPGSLVFAGEPIWQMQVADCCDVSLVSRVLAEAGLDVQLRQPQSLTQIYRQLDEQGRFTRDVMRPLSADPIAGQVLLQPTWLNGRWAAQAMNPQAIDELTRMQRSAMPAQDAVLPVVTEM